MKSSYIVGLFGILVLIFTSFYYFRNISWNQNYIPKIKNHTLLERFARARSMELLLPLQTATKWSWLKSRIAFSSTAAAASFSGGWPACFLLLLLLLLPLTSGRPAAAAPVSWYQLTWQSSPFRRARLSSERLSEIFRYTSVSSSSSLLKISSLELS